MESAISALLDIVRYSFDNDNACTGPALGGATVPPEWLAGRIAVLTAGLVYAEQHLRVVDRPRQAGEGGVMGDKEPPPGESASLPGCSMTWTPFPGSSPSNRTPTSTHGRSPLSAAMVATPALPSFVAP